MQSPSTRLVILIALPATGLLILGVVWWMLPSPRPPAPTPQPAPEPGMETDPHSPDIVEHDPAPPPATNAPDSAVVAEAMKTEAFSSMKRIRSRLELKYKYADYKHDSAWTVKSVMRRPERLDGEYFLGMDFKLQFDDPEEPVVTLSAATAQGINLPDGPLTLTVDLSSGKSTEAGELYARDRNGRLLLSDEHYDEGSSVLMSALYHWVTLQRLGESDDERRSDENDRFERNLGYGLEEFDRDDLVVGKTLPNGKIEFSLRTLKGQPMSWPCVLYVDQTNMSVEIAEAPSTAWMPVPSDAEWLKRYLSWRISNHCKDLLSSDSDTESLLTTPSPDALPIYVLETSESLPSDWTIDLERGETTKLVFQLHSSFGRALPFGKLRYVYDVKANSGEFETP